MTDGKFTMALEQFLMILHTIPLIYVTGKQSVKVWYFEEGGVVLRRGWCGTLKRVMW